MNWKMKTNREKNNEFQSFLKVSTKLAMLAQNNLENNRSKLPKISNETGTSLAFLLKLKVLEYYEQFYAKLNNLN